MARPEFAFYYPNPYWYNSNWVKNLILFFDGIAMLIPDYMEDHSRLDDLAVIQGLKEHNLFQVVRPETTVDAKATEKLVESMIDILISGALDNLASRNSDFGSLSMSRLGYLGDETLAQLLFEELKKKNLARDSEDGVSIPMHGRVRALILVLLAHILRPAGDSLGIELSPATDQPNLVNTMTEILSLPNTPSASNVVLFDMNIVGTDLSAIPIDEILSFRQENYVLHRNYSLSVRRFVRELSAMPEGERTPAFELRQEELNDIANEIRRASRSAWKKPSTFALGLAGAAWTLTTGDVVGALLASSSAILAAEKGEKVDTGAYSFLFNARSTYG